MPPPPFVSEFNLEGGVKVHNSERVRERECVRERERERDDHVSFISHNHHSHQLLLIRRKTVSIDDRDHLSVLALSTQNVIFTWELNRRVTTTHSFNNRMQHKASGEVLGTALASDSYRNEFHKAVFPAQVTVICIVNN